MRLVALIPEPTLILSCGMNYHEHLREMNTPVPETPTAFTKNAASVIGPGETIRLPRSAPTMVDWEGEFTVVIGKAAFDVSESEAMKHVAGYTIINDVSARDWVAPIFASKGIMPSILAWEHNILGKQFPTFCPMGPAIVTADDIDDATQCPPLAQKIVLCHNFPNCVDNARNTLVFQIESRAAEIIAGMAWLKSLLVNSFPTRSGLALVRKVSGFPTSHSVSIA